MLSSLKKPSESAEPRVPAWHPNFRDMERLPDTKVVRTAFFLNALAITVTITLATVVAFREYKLNALRSEAAVVRASIASNNRANEQALASYKRFQEEEKKVQALQAFLAAPKLVLSDFLLNLGASLPEGISFRSVDYRPTIVILGGDVEGSPDEATGRANDYVESLKKSEVFKKLFGSVTLTNIAKDPGTGTMQFSIELKYLAPAGPAPRK